MWAHRDGLSAALGTVHHAVVVVSDRMTGIGVAGRRARDVLAAGCPLDLHPAVFAPGTATRTLLGKAAVVLRRPDAADGTSSGSTGRSHPISGCSCATPRSSSA